MSHGLILLEPSLRTSLRSRLTNVILRFARDFVTYTVYLKAMGCLYHISNAS